MMESVRSSETYAYSNETTWCNIPVDCNLYFRRRENMKSYQVTAY
jgi:hypothetical protein